MPKITFQGEEVEAEEIDFLSTGENWNSYQLSDGTVLRMRAIVGQVFRIPSRYDNDGNPLYVVKSSNILVVRSPEDLKHK